MIQAKDITIAVDKARELLTYDATTGLLTWNVRRDRPKSWNSRYANKPAGRVSNGYISLSINGSSHQAHRVAWFLFYGVNPDGFIDHINGDRSDNRIDNLRLVSDSENKKNRRLQKNNSSGVPGVSLRGSGWRVRIKSNGKELFLGSFDNFFDAVCARKSTQNKMGFNHNHGSPQYLFKPNRV